MRSHCWGESFFVEPMTMRKTSNSARRSISLFSRSSIGGPDTGLPSFAKQRADVCIGLVSVDDPPLLPEAFKKPLARVRVQHSLACSDLVPPDTF